MRTENRTPGTLRLANALIGDCHMIDTEYGCKTFEGLCNMIEAETACVDLLAACEAAIASLDELTCNGNIEEGGESAMLRAAITKATK